MTSIRRSSQKRIRRISFIAEEIRGLREGKKEREREREKERVSEREREINEKV